jgi:1-acyl-sn-glycerol-3-phosphate acyltransferase
MIIVSKWDVIMLPFLGIPWSLACGHILVDRKKKDSGRQAIMRGIELVKQGYCVFLFPEGTRREGTDGKVQDAKIGAFKMAKDAGVPIVPITIRGANTIMPNGKFALRTGTVQLTVHPAVDSSKFELNDLKTTVMTKIQSKMIKGD